MLRHWDLGSALQNGPWTSLPMSISPETFHQRPWTEKIAGKKGWTCLCPLIAIRGNLSRRSAPMHPWPTLSASP